jgi:gluconolactonase
MRSIGLIAAAMLTAVPVAATAQTAPAPARIERSDPALDALIAPGAVPERVATGFTFTEGPMWRNGVLWFSDVNGDKMRSVTPSGEVKELIANSGGLPNPPVGKSIGSNGMAPDKNGTVLMAQMGARRIARVDAKLNVTPFITEYQGKRLNSPNDLVFARDGSLWFTDPPFGLFNGMDKDPAKELPFNAVWRYADGKLTPAITDLKLPNGIAFSPDGKQLYVGDYAANTIFAYDVGANGKLGAPRTVIVMPRSGPGGADGIKVDTKGNIWATGPGGIRILTPQGKVLGQIVLPEVAANLAFGGDGHTLWITASTSVYRLNTKVAGVLPRYMK